MKTKSITKREGGITLISLIVMIILLVILAAVAIRGITGEERHFRKYNNSSTKILYRRI